MTPQTISVHLAQKCNLSKKLAYCTFFIYNSTNTDFTRKFQRQAMSKKEGTEQTCLSSRFLYTFFVKIAQKILEGV